MSETTPDKGPLEQRMTVQADGRISHLSLQWFYDPSDKPESMDNFYTIHKSHVQPLICGEKTLPQVLHALQSAAKTIDIGIWCFDPALCLKGYNPDLWKTATLLDSLAPPYDASPRIGDLLLAAALRGVEVRLTVWSLGDLMYNPIHWKFAAFNFLTSKLKDVILECIKESFYIIRAYLDKATWDKYKNIMTLIGCATVVGILGCIALKINPLRLKDEVKSLVMKLFETFMDFASQKTLVDFAGIFGVLKSVHSIFGEAQSFLNRFDIIYKVDMISNLMYRLRWYKTLKDMPKIRLSLIGEEITPDLIERFLKRIVTKTETRDAKGRTHYERMFEERDELKKVALDFNTHHQKCVIVDYNTPEAVGFVMGNNFRMVDFDSLAHPMESGVKGGRFPDEVPRQDIASFVRGPVLHDMMRNYNAIWKGGRPSHACQPQTAEMPVWIELIYSVYEWLFSKMTLPASLSEQQKLLSHPEVLAARKRSQDWLAGLQLPEGNCQLSTTRIAYKGQENSIAKAYRRAIGCCTSFIYFENQYFRYKKMAIALKKRANDRHSGNESQPRSPIYFFVVINNEVEMVAHDSTHDMMSTLGHAGQMPAQAHKEYKQLYEKKKRLSKNVSDAATRAELANVQAKMEELERGHVQLKPGKKPGKPKKAEDIETAEEAFILQESEFLKGHIAVLKIGRPYKAVWLEKTDVKFSLSGVYNLFPWVDDKKYYYKSVNVHTKTTIVDDVYIIIGSANMHERGMEYDNEIDISTTRPGAARDTRRTLFAAYTENNETIMNEQAGWAEVYNGWKKLLDKNWERHHKSRKLVGMLFYFYNPTVDATFVTLD